MKNLANILRRADITPQERVITLVQNDVYREEYGKSILSESEIYSLTQGWRPKNSHDVNEYNKYLELSRIEQTMRFDSYGLSLKGENSILRSIMLIENAFFEKNLVNQKDERAFMSKYISKEDVISFIIENTYVEYDKLIHLITLNNISEDLRNDIIILDEYVIYDKKYLEDEVFLYELFQDSTLLSSENKNLLIEKIFSCVYHDGIRKLKNGTEKDGFLTLHFFAELPVEAILNKWAEYSHTDLNGKDSKYLLDNIEEYANIQNKTMEIIIKETLSKWIDDGLFITEYTPLFLSDGFNTWNGNTKKKHKDIFIEWYKELQKTKNFIQKCVVSGGIKVENFNSNLFNTPSVKKIVTGRSVYVSTIKEEFISEYRKQIELLIPLAYTFLFIEKYTNPLKTFTTLQAFLKISNYFSDVFEIDMNSKYQKNLESLEQDLDVLNATCTKQLDKISESLSLQETKFHFLEIKTDQFLFLKESSSTVQPDSIIDDYKKHIKKSGFTIE
ncbi:MAG: hypothetical protein QG654_577 [Patescibacteria group bacterium]|nr:hypothetical protein [Patescibacteria group bacterium]